MRRMLEKVISCYGRSVVLHRGEETHEIRAFLQPMTERVERLMQFHPGSLGLEDRDRFVYIGPLEPEARQGDRVTAQGESYQIRSAQRVYGSGEAVYIWAACVKEGGDDNWGMNG